ncbi:MAG: NTP transferase domain-containing protein [Myxococcales bacterium]|nr:NTP transferase domain-containing protein [Myxococcales bacterium]MCB9735670.1 NTP transferase domain-containing protein [Deltaproteobacteria bacterium]
MGKIIAVILGGGRGERLRPLTSARAKPAVPIAGKFRLVDIPISACLNSSIHDIFVLTQFLSASLNRHIGQTYRFDAFRAGQVAVLAAEQAHDSDNDGWYQGTADAVRKQLHRFEANDDDDILILSGDQVYMMDLAAFAAHHRKANADVTIAATRVSREDATRFGVMKVDDEALVRAFAEKPKEAEVLDDFAAPNAPEGLSHLASMGIYLFRYEVLRTLLAEDQRDDFGKHILHTALANYRLASYPFTGYWEDVGTIRSYHKVNLELTDPIPELNLFSEKSRLYSRQRFLPPAKVGEALVQRALLSDGAVIGDGATVRKSVVGIRAVIGPGCTLERVVVNGAGSYDFADTERAEKVPLGIGEFSILRDAIVDRDARVGRGVKLLNAAGVANYQDEHIHVRDGIIVVPRRGVVPDGYTF